MVEATKYTTTPAVQRERQIHLNRDAERKTPFPKLKPVSSWARFGHKRSGRNRYFAARLRSRNRPISSPTPFSVKKRDPTQRCPFRIRP